MTDRLVLGAWCVGAPYEFALIVGLIVLTVEVFFVFFICSMIEPRNARREQRQSMVHARI
jgi:hypothetical protein